VWRIQRGQPAQPGARQYARYRCQGNAQRSRNATHRLAMPAHGDDPLRRAARNRRGRVMGPRAAVDQSRRPQRQETLQPLAYRLAVDAKARRHRSDRLAAGHRLHHAQSPFRRHWGILMSVHSVLLVGSDGLGTISFFQLDRGDNLLRLHN
jgi:hypothetical protein